MAKRIFISKHLHEINPIRSQLESLGYTLDAHSFLSFIPVEFDVDQAYDVIFFGGPRTVIFFLNQQSIPASTQIGCVGEKTAELVISLGREVAFCGSESGNPQATAQEFKKWLGKRRVFFPVSDRSLKTISKPIPSAQKEVKIAYKTELDNELVEDSDVYVFTSPTNVEGIFGLNKIPKAARVIAWGKSTETALISRAVPVEYCLKKSSLEELLAYLKSK